MMRNGRHAVLLRQRVGVPTITDAIVLALDDLDLDVRRPRS